ncbi:hypothetical protein FF1_009226 [Malus domestica]
MRFNFSFQGTIGYVNPIFPLFCFHKLDGRESQWGGGAEAEQQPVVRPYHFHEIELKWQRHWEEIGHFRTPNEIDTSKPKYYLLDMFPYPRARVLFVVPADEDAF